MKTIRLTAVLFMLMFLSVSIASAVETAPFYKNIDKGLKEAAGEKPVVEEFFADW